MAFWIWRKIWYSPCTKQNWKPNCSTINKSSQTKNIQRRHKNRCYTNEIALLSLEKPQLCHHWAHPLRFRNYWTQAYTLSSLAARPTAINLTSFGVYSVVVILESAVLINWPIEFGWWINIKSSMKLWWK